MIFEEIIRDRKKLLMTAVPAGAVLLLLIAVLVVKIAGGGNKVQIDAFMGNKWGAEFEKVYKEVVSDEMEEEEDYTLNELDLGYSFKTLRVMKSSVDGHDASVYYDFKDDKLILGGYKLDEEAGPWAMLETFKKRYGEPVLDTNIDDEHGVVWIDEDKNIILCYEYTVTYCNYDREFLWKLGIFDTLKDAGLDLDNVENGKPAENTIDDNFDGI